MEPQLLIGPTSSEMIDHRTSLAGIRLFQHRHMHANLPSTQLKERDDPDTPRDQPHEEQGE